MVKRIMTYTALAGVLILSGLALAREFYQFPRVPDLQKRDVILIRRPAAVGFSNLTGNRTLDGTALYNVFATYSAMDVGLDSKSSIGHGHTIPYITGLQAILDGKVETSDARLSDARTPLAHSQSADTITDGTTNRVFTSSEKSKLATIATGATVQINSDWYSTSGITQILNRPAETCPGRFSYDGSVIFTGTGAPSSGTGVKNDFYIDTVNGDYYRKEGDPVAWVLKANLVGPPGADGDPGPAGNTYTCAIIGGIRTITYDSNGINPAPAMTAFSVEMRENGSIITPASFTWSVPASGSLLSGSSATATFTPSVDSTWSAGAADNRVDVILTYAGQTCRTTAPISITKVGATGTAGSPDTKQQIYAKIDDPVTGDVLRTQCGPGDAASFAAREVLDSNGDIIMSYTCGGVVTVYQLPGDTTSSVKLQVKDTGGIVRFSVTAGGTVTIR